MGNVGRLCLVTWQNTFRKPHVLFTFLPFVITVYILQVSSYEYLHQCWPLSLGWVSDYFSESVTNLLERFVIMADLPAGFHALPVHKDASCRFNFFLCTSLSLSLSWAFPLTSGQLYVLDIVPVPIFYWSSFCCLSRLSDWTIRWEAEASWFTWRESRWLCHSSTNHQSLPLWMGHTASNKRQINKK